PLMVTLIGVVPSVTRTIAFVLHPDGAVFACACTRVMVSALSKVHVAPVHVDDSAPGRKIFCSERGDAVIASPLMDTDPVLIPALVMPERKAVSVVGGDAPHEKLKVSA